MINVPKGFLRKENHLNRTHFSIFGLKRLTIAGAVLAVLVLSLGTASAAFDVKTVATVVDKLNTNRESLADLAPRFGEPASTKKSLFPAKLEANTKTAMAAPKVSGVTLSPGDIVVIGMNADGDDNFGILTLADIPAAPVLLSA